MNRDSTVAVKVWSDFALFTRPEMKVERVSYPVMTPSAARGVLEAIFWQPEFAWRVREIHILKPIRWFSILRNEVARRVAKSPAPLLEDYADAPDLRTQRHAVILRDVAYVIIATMHLRPHATDPLAKYRAIFRRRVARGQCFQRPYMGCREFAAQFGPPRAQDRPIPTHLELGTMLFDMRFARRPEEDTVPLFFQAIVRDGVVRVPQNLYQRTEAS